jgi:pimeloyl-ACP methyl ester carboxylesterase
MKKIILLFAFVFAFVIVYANTYVLVHGQGGDATNWDGIAKILRSKGHRVIVLNLPGHGGDKTNLTDITIERYCQRVIDSINIVSEKVILVGHSMGGIVITKVNDMIPGRIGKLVYLTAILPKSGQSLFDILAQDSVRHLNPVFNADTTLLLKYSATGNLGDFGCNDCPVDIRNYLSALPQKPSPSKPMFEKVYFNKETLDATPVYFICATEDMMIPYSTQLKMIAENGHVKKVFELKMGHLMPLIQATEAAAILDGL